MLDPPANYRPISKHDLTNQHSHSSLLSAKEALGKSSAKFNAYK